MVSLFLKMIQPLWDAKKKLEEGVAITKEFMNKLEERNNDDKEERLIFGEEESSKVRMLGSYVGQKEDTRQRIKRAGGAWVKVERQLKKSRMPKPMQARIVQAVVESSMLFDYQTWPWRLGEIRRLKSCVDRMYRHV